uniref:Putative DNA recombination protein n=1 Tax=viral metagenome TaxID=1070528 RepID=A0A6H2A6G0_9ZZZZ
MEAQAKYEVAKNEGMDIITQQAQVSMFLNEQRFEFAQRIGNMLAKSTMVPEHFRANLGNCLIALNLAERLGIDVFALMQTSYVVKGRPGFEAKLLIAIFNAKSKLFMPPLRWEFKGDFPYGQDAGCRAYAKDKETDENLYGEWIDFKMIKKMGWYDKKGPDGTVDGNMWRSIPGQMYRYRAASFFINVYEPGLKMGIRTVDELEDTIIDITPLPSLKIEGQKEPEPGADPYEVKTVQKEKPTTNGRGGGTAPPSPDDPPPPSSAEKAAAETPDEKTLFRDEWVNLRSAGYSTYIHKNFRRIEKDGERWPDFYREMQEKWAKLYKEPWPLVEKAPETPPERAIPAQSELSPVDQGEGMGEELSDADSAYLLEVEEYQGALDPANYETVARFFGVAKRSALKLEEEDARIRFLAQLKKALDRQNAA